MFLSDNRLIAGIETAPYESEIAIIVIEKALIPESCVIREGLLKYIFPPTSITSYVHKRNSISFSLSSNRTRTQSIANESVELFRLLFLRHHAAAVEDFKLGARVETEKLCGLLDWV